MPKQKIKKCKVENCERKHQGRGYCVNHYNLWKYHNDPRYRERYIERQKLYNQKNKKRLRKSKIDWYNKNKEKLKKKQVAYNTNRLQTDEEYKKKEYVKKRTREKLKRDSNCAKCNSTENLQFHHISYDSPDNAITLCRTCHFGEHYEK